MGRSLARAGAPALRDSSAPFPPLAPAPRPCFSLAAEARSAKAANRQIRILEHPVSHRKQTTAPRSNRQKTRNAPRSRVLSSHLPPRHCSFNRYTLQTKSAVTHTKQRTNELSIGTLFRSAASVSSVVERRILFDTRVETESPVTPRKQRVAARSNRYNFGPFACRFRSAQLPSPGGNILLKPGRSL